VGKIAKELQQINEYDGLGRGAPEPAIKGRYQGPYKAEVNAL